VDLYPIHWLTLLWGAVIAILLTLAAMNLQLAARRQGRDAAGHALFALLAVGAAGTGVSELLLSNSRTAEQYGALLSLAHIPVGLLVLVIPWVVLFLFRSGRRWLAVLANAVWGAALLASAFLPYSRVFATIARVERIALPGGAEFTWAAGPGQPARWVGYAGVFLTLLFVFDAAAGLWRRGESRRALIVGACLGTSLAIGLFHSMLVETGTIRSPYVISLAFLVIMAGIAFELVDDAARAPVLARQVQVQEAEVAHLSRQSMLGEMTVGIAHELNQPLSGILNNAQAALSFLDRETPDLTEVHDALVEIADQDRHATEVVAGFARVLESGRRRSELVDLNQCCQEVLELARSDLARRGITTVTDLAGGLPGVRGDRILLCMILFNLVRNAADAMTEDVERSGRRMEIATRARERSVELTVSDRGPGIRAEDRERVFDPFYTTRPDGSGLGLAVARTLAEMHGGEVWSADGPDGIGTSMHVRLPTAPALLQLRTPT
jgi:signal transduction histidine kinase